MTSPSEKASRPEPADEALADFSVRCDATEEAHEFMLAYAARACPPRKAARQAARFASSSGGARPRCGSGRGGDGLCPPARRSIASTLRPVHQRRRTGRAESARPSHWCCAAVNRLTARGQPERVHSSAHGSHRSIPPRRSTKKVERGFPGPSVSVGRPPLVSRACISIREAAFGVA